ncbi:MAG: glycoside hydrolase family 76 protein [Dysgonomonas sp.]
MKKLFYVTLFLVLSKSLFPINISTGQAYKISSAALANKSMFVKNASLSNDAEVVLWIETNVQAQRWLFSKNSDNTYSLTNAYSEKALFRKGNAVDGASVNQSDNVSTSASNWMITPVEGQAGYYYITQTHKDGNIELYLETASTDDGATITLGEKKSGDALQRQIWKIELADIRNGFSQTVRDELMSGWKAKYYNKATTGYVLGNGGWWGDAEMLEVVLDAYETTGDPAHETMFRELYKNFIFRNKSNWSYNEFNDDIAWMVIASLRGYLLFGDASYLTYAKTNFDQMYARALLPSGMLRWKEGTAETQNGTNSCINGPAEVAACYLGIALGDESYFKKAKDLYALQRKYLYVPATGQVYDSFSWENDVPSNYNYWASTYNQGTFMGAAMMLYNHYGDKQYKEDAGTIMKYTFDNLCDENGIIKVCQVGSGDLAGFKGILMRYVRRFIVDFQKTEYVGWMQKNALHAYNNRNSVGITSSAWKTKTPENFILSDCSENCSFQNDPFGPSTAVSVAFNASLDENRIMKDAFSDIQAENFDYLKGVYVQAGTGGNQYQIGNIKDGFYTAYGNVNFANNLASTIEIRLSKATVKSTIEIRLGSVDGDLLGTISVPREGDDWQTVSQNITPVSGLQNIYLVFRGVASQNDLFKIDYFHFKSDVYIYSDITDNGGDLTSSIETNSLNNAIDNRLNTSVVFPTNGNVWLQYKSPAAVALQAYAVYSGDANADEDIKSWKLQASNNGTDWVDLDVQTDQQFSARYGKKTYNVSTNDSYLYFRLNIASNNGNSGSMQFADWQLYGSSIFSNDITSDGGTLEAEFAGKEPNETYTKLTDKDSSTKYVVEGESDLWVEYKARGVYKLTSYSLTSANDSPESDPKHWTLYGSSDGVSWEKIDEQQNQYFGYRNCSQFYSSKTAVGYQYFKLHITANNGATLTQLGEWQLFGSLYYDFLFNDITMNGGDLSSSDNATKEQLTSLIDNNGNTVYTQDVSSLPAWIQYKSTIPAKLLAYSVVAGYDSDKDPRNWTLQGSNDGQTWTSIHTRSNITFSQRGERKTYTVSTTSKYIYFRLNVTRLSNTGSTEMIVGELELHGTGISSDDITANANGGTLEAEFSDLNATEGVGKLIDKSESSKYYNTFFGSLWVSYRSPNPVTVRAYSITSANDEEGRDPRSWTLEASNDGNNWDLIDSRNKQQFPFRGVTQYYACNKNLKDYRYFRLNITENGGAQYIQFAEWQLLNIDGAGGEVNKIETPKADNDIIFYPNPVQDILYVNMPMDGSVRIFNTSGKTVFNEKINAGLQSLQLNHLEKGLYLMSIVSGNSLINRKIIKK